MAEETLEEYYKRKFSEDSRIVEENISSLKNSIFDITQPPKKNNKLEKEILRQINELKQINKRLVVVRKDIKKLEKEKDIALKNKDVKRYRELIENVRDLKRENFYKTTKLGTSIPLSYKYSELSKARGQEQRIYFHTPVGNISIRADILRNLKNPALSILKRLNTRFNKSIGNLTETLIYQDEEGRVKTQNQINGLESLKTSIELNIHAIKKGVSVKELDPDVYEIYYSYEKGSVEIDINIIGGGSKPSKTSSKIKDLEL